MNLRDVLYISYAVDAERLSKLLPEPLQLAMVGEDTAFISIVVLRSTQVRLKPLQLPRFNYNQLNIRTYVIDPVSGEHAVYFIKSGVTSRFISLATRTSGIPWQLIDLETKINMVESKNSYTASGNWEGEFSIKVKDFIAEPRRTPFFTNDEAAVDFLVRPLIGFVGDNRKLGRFTIDHPEVKPGHRTLTELDFPLFTNLGVVDGLSNLHSVLFLPTADFSIYLPPKRIK